MARKFFVGGNFKMNPITREAKLALVKVLNEANLDPKTGELSSKCCNRDDRDTIARGHNCSSNALCDPVSRVHPPGYPSSSSELFLQRLGSIYWRDQVL